MKLKYKKIIILTTMSTMGIGLLTLSLTHNRPNTKESVNTSARPKIHAKADKDITTNTDDITSIANITITPTVQPTPSPSPAPSPAPLPVYNIEKKGNKKITSLMQDYYAAKISCDIKKLKSLLSDPSKVETQHQLQNKTEYIEDYRKIKCYVKKGIEEGSYIVYVYQEVKITGINTAAPSLAKFYVVKNKKGKYKIYTDTMTPELKKYFDDRNKDTDVKKLIKSTNNKSKKAKKKDADLRKFWSDIDKMAKKHKKSANDKESAKE